MIVGPFEEPDFLPPFPFFAPLAAAFFGGMLYYLKESGIEDLHYIVMLIKEFSDSGAPW
jgi:hypothetical protein